MSRYFNDELYHFGIKHRSGRYKYGSGERPYQGEGGIKSHKISGKTIRNVAAASAAVAGAGATVAAARKNGVTPEKAKGFLKTYGDPNIKQGKGKADESAFEVTSKSATKGLEGLSKVVASSSNLASASQDAMLAAKASKMSDEDLRAIVNRKNLERQYVQAMRDPSVTSGYEKTQQVLSVVMAGVGVAGGAASIYSAFHQKK